MACYDNGKIYRLHGKIFPSKVLIGSYENGHVYKGKNKNNHVGEYDENSIYKGKGIFRKKVGTYKGEEGGAAAALILLFYKDVLEIW